MDFNIYDIYVDASINLERKIGCAGMILVDRKRDIILDSQYLIKDNASNNMCEIIALWMGVIRAVNLLYTENIPFHVNIFSDSQISLFGMREWIPGWVLKRKGHTLINSVGAVANQEWFEDAYHAILASGLKLKFFHQKGHVCITNPKSLFLSDKVFRASNTNSPHMIGVAPKTLAIYNNYVDETSRDILNNLINGVNVYQASNVNYIFNIPMIYDFTDEAVEIYKSQIRGGLNYPINFNGGK